MLRYRRPVAPGPPRMAVVALASHGMDSHNCRPIAVDRLARNEGNVEAGVAVHDVAYAGLRRRLLRDGAAL